MVTRNITLYTLGSDGKKTQIQSPYRLDMGFEGGSITIYVAVDNSFDNDSYSVSCDNYDVVIKRLLNEVTIVVNPNYDARSRDIIVTFEHNIDENDVIPLLIRQTWQPYNIIVQPDWEDPESENFVYVSKNGTQLEYISYRVRDNVILNDGEKSVIQGFDGLSISRSEVTPLIYEDEDENELYYDAYAVLDADDAVRYSPKFYMFSNNEYNEFSESDLSEDANYKPYKYSSEDGETIDASEYEKLPEEPDDDIIISKQHYPNVEYIRVYTEDDIAVEISRYNFTPSSYRNTITRTEYTALPEDSKNGCSPLTYVNIHDDTIELSNDEYENLSQSNRYHYDPNRYVVFENLSDNACKKVVTSDEYNEYPIEGRYDYKLESAEQEPGHDDPTPLDPSHSPILPGRYYREISVDDYASYHEKGQIEYDVYQYINKDDVNDVIDFVTYNNLDVEKQSNYRIYRYSSSKFIKIVRKIWVYYDTKLLTEDEYSVLSDEEKANYQDITMDDGQTYYLNKNAYKTDEEYKELDVDEQSKYEKYYYETETKNKNDFINTIEEERRLYIPDDIITPSKYDSLPFYGKNYYKPHKLKYSKETDDTYDEIITEVEKTFDEYLQIPLTRSDYVIDTVDVIDDEISHDGYDQLEENEQEEYELTYKISNIFKDDYSGAHTLELDVFCIGGSYDFIINGVTKYRRSVTYSYTDDIEYEATNYKITNGEVFINESTPFKITKWRGGEKVEIRDDNYAKNKLYITIYGWLDSTFIHDILDGSVFYRVELSHKDIVGLNKSIKIVFDGNDVELHKLVVGETVNNNVQLAPPMTLDGIIDKDSIISKREEAIMKEAYTDILPYEPSIECDGVGEELEFRSWSSSQTVHVTTTPSNAAITVKYSGRFIEKITVNGHDVEIKVQTNKFGVERKCRVTLINAAYPSQRTSFRVVQLAD